MQLRIFLIAIAFNTLLGCAAPSAIREQQHFVSPLELEVYRLNNEGLRQASTGRVMDGWMEFEKALALAPDNFPVRLNLAITLRELGLLKESEQLLLELLSDQPSNIDVLSALALVYFADGRAAIGNDAFMKAIDIAIKQERWDLAGRQAAFLSEAWYNSANLQEALCYADLAVSLQPVAINAQLLARNMLEAGQYERLVTLIDTRRIVLGQDGKLRMYSALAELGRGNLKSGIEQLERLELGIKKFPDIAADIQTLRVLASAKEQALANNTAVEWKLLSETDREKLDAVAESVYDSKARLRSWPVEYRELLSQFVQEINESDE